MGKLSLEERREREEARREEQQRRYRAENEPGVAIEDLRSMLKETLGPGGWHGDTDSIYESLALIAIALGVKYDDESQRYFPSDFEPLPALLVRGVGALERIAAALEEKKP